MKALCGVVSLLSWQLSNLWQLSVYLSVHPSTRPASVYPVTDSFPALLLFAGIVSFVAQAGRLSVDFCVWIYVFLCVSELWLRLTLVLVSDAVGQDGEESSLFGLLSEAEVQVSPVGQTQVDGKLPGHPWQRRSEVLLHTWNTKHEVLFDYILKQAFSASNMLFRLIGASQPLKNWLFS